MRTYLKLQRKARAKVARQEQKRRRRFIRKFKVYLGNLLKELALKGAKESIDYGLPRLQKPATTIYYGDHIKTTNSIESSFVLIKARRIRGIQFSPNIDKISG